MALEELLHSSIAKAVERKLAEQDTTRLDPCCRTWSCGVLGGIWREVLGSSPFWAVGANRCADRPRACRGPGRSRPLPNRLRRPGVFHSNGSD